MGREIKFRAWDGNKWLVDSEWSSICIDTDGGVSRFSYAFESFDSLDDVTLTQYTGLKDRNGTLIYEGDIVTLPIGVGHECMKAEIIWGFCGWEFKWLDNRTAAVRRNESEPIFHNVELFEVIGNVFEGVCNGDSQISEAP